MPHRSSWIVMILLVVAALQLVACSGAQDAGAASEEPATVEKNIDGTEYERVILTQRAAERLDIETEAIAEEGDQLTVPYSAVLYGINGETWVYTSPEPLTYVRAPITVDVIEGDLAMLTDGPEAGTDVVITGAQMLLGTGTGVGK